MAVRTGKVALVLVLALTGCNVFQDRAEFAPPQERWNRSQPSQAMADAPPPAVSQEYCYRTLADVDCFSQAVPDRITGYTGLYPEPDSLPPASDPQKRPAR